jgi:RNA polymerase sigma-70 factor (ECF subfamily)
MTRLATSSQALTGPPEAALLGRCVSGDERAWRDLYRAQYPVAGAFLRKLGVRSRELEDATQEVFVQLFRALPQFRGEAQLKTWLYKLCVTQARRVRRWRAVSHALGSWFGGTEPQSVHQELTPDLAVQRVSAALEQLSEADRLVLVLYEFESLSGDQIAQIVDCPVATVWRRLHYGRRRFRSALGVGYEADS